MCTCTYIRKKYRSHTVLLYKIAVIFIISFQELLPLTTLHTLLINFSYFSRRFDVTLCRFDIGKSPTERASIYSY